VEIQGFSYNEITSQLLLEIGVKKIMVKNLEAVNIPVHRGQLVELPVHGYGHEGEGVGRYRDFTLFIPGALQGEVVRVRITEVKKNFARGVLTEVIQPIPERIQPLCSTAAECGGCQLQHLNYAAQLGMKRQRVVDAIERIGGLAGVTVHPVAGMAEPWHYRNKVQYPVGRAADGTVAMGFYRQGTHQIVPMDGCLLQTEVINRIAAVLQKLIAEYQIPVYDEKTGRGLLRHVLIRQGFTSGEVMVVLVINGEHIPRLRELVTSLATIEPGIKSVVQNINTSRGNVILGAQTRLIWGRNTIVDQLDGLQFKISPRSFFQVNPVQTEVLYNKAVEYAGLTGRETVVDAYCGVGSLTLFLARKAKTVYGIEVVPEAIRDAKENAVLNGIGNSQFLVGETEKVLPELVGEGIRFDVGVVDPPRSGCERTVFESFAANGVGKIVYVSCNPSTLARDLKVLAELGYRTVEIQPVDMFPQTFHVECIAKIVRNVSRVTAP
jgi:23S rRNA (uracil1939-C5)-methyltransferase